MNCPGLSCRRDLIRWAKRQLDNSADVEDLVGEVCLHCMRARDRFRGDAEFSTWLRRIAMNVLSDFLSAERARGAISCRVPETQAAPTAERHVGRYDVENLWEAMDRLTPRHRHLLEWKYGDELTYDEIAARLGTSAAAVSQALRRARQSLKRAIEAQAGG